MKTKNPPRFLPAFLAILAFSALAQAQEPVKDFWSLKNGLEFTTKILSDEDSIPGCEYLLKRSLNTLVSRQYSPTTGNCYISVRPLNPKNLLYRSFLFTNDGMLMVFNSFGPGTVSETTGAREFYLFPRLTAFPQLEIRSNGDIAVRAQSGHEFLFNAELYQLTAVSEADVTEDLNVTKKNKGGVELKLHRGLLLDLGFTMGQSPADEASRSVFFKDVQNQQCVIKNRDIFTYRDDEVYLEKSDAQIKKQFRPVCSKLNFGF